MIQQLVEQHLIKEQEKSKKRIRSGRWSPSSFGRCYRYQFWNRLDEAQSNPPDLHALKNFSLGNILHSFVQNIISHQVLSIIESNISNDDCEAYVDLELADEVVELKTIHPFGFKKMQNRGYDIVSDKPHNILQCMYYAIIKKKDIGRLVYISKDDMQMKEFTFETNEWVERVATELKILNDFWKQKKLPPPLPRLSWDCNYCNFKDKCAKDKI